MVRHLWSLGHRRIAMIAGPEGNFDARRAPARLRRDARPARAGAPARRCCAATSPRSRASAPGGELAAMRERPEAVFAANDMMAIGCLFALADGGPVACRGDVALAGFDDIPIARYVNPPLTTVRVRIAELGEFALDRLMRADRAARAATSLRSNCCAPSWWCAGRAPSHARWWHKRAERRPNQIDGAAHAPKRGKRMKVPNGRWWRGAVRRGHDRCAAGGCAAQHLDRARPRDGRRGAREGRRPRVPRATPPMAPR